MLKRCIYNLPLMFIFILLCLLIFMINGQSGKERIWDQYYIVAIPEGDAETILDKEIFSGNEIVSFYTTELHFNDFGTLSKVALKDLEDRFVEGDPRVDPYMLNVSKYFFTQDDQGHKYELLYVKSNKPIWDFYFHSKHVAGKLSADWIFPDFSFKSRISSIILFLVCWLFGIWLIRGLRLIGFFAGIPWMIGIIVNGAGFLPVSVSVLLLLILLVREIFPDVLFYMNYGRLRLGPGVFLFAAALLIAVISNIIAAGISSGPILPVFMALAADIVFLFVFISLKGQRVRMQEHRLFFPVSLSAGAGPERGTLRLPELAAVMTAIILIPMFILFYQDRSEIEVPVPQQTAENFNNWSWESLEYIDKTYDGLVNAADLVTHTAFQEGFMYGRKYVFPQPDEKIMIGKYVVVNNEIEYNRTCVRQFTDNWYISIIKPELSTGLTALLLSQSSPGGIILKSDISEAVSSFNPVGHLILSLLAILPVLWQFISNVSITVRRKGQEA